MLALPALLIETAVHLFALKIWPPIKEYLAAGCKPVTLLSQGIVQATEPGLIS